MAGVQPLLGAHDGVRSYTVIDAGGLPIEPAEVFLRHLTVLGYSPNTVKSYAHDLADFFTWGASARIDWRSASIDEVGDYRVLAAVRDQTSRQVFIETPTAEAACPTCGLFTAPGPPADPVTPSRPPVGWPGHALMDQEKVAL